MFLLNIFEFIGTVVFAISGTLIAIQKKLDLFGILTLSIVTAVGGGIFRDIIIGTTPPMAFKNPFFCFISILTSIITISLYSLISKFTYKKALQEYEIDIFDKDYNSENIKHRINFLRKRTAILKKFNSIFDAIGLGIFTAVGSNIAISNKFSNLFLVICMGSITGIGGGILRDIFVQDIPVVFKKEIYAIASILGAFAFWFLYKHISIIHCLYISAFVTFSFRILSLHFNWNLPKLTIEILK